MNHSADFKKINKKVDIKKSFVYTVYVQYTHIGGTL